MLFISIVTVVLLKPECKLAEKQTVTSTFVGDCREFGMLWYVRDKNKVTGPFPTGHVQQAVLLGRISPTAEVSRDREGWIALSQVSELIPDVMKGDATDEHVRERLAAARRWADERRRERRAGDDDPARQGPGRRDQEPETTIEYRDHREEVVQSFRPSQEKMARVMVFVLLVLGAGLYAGFHWVPKAPATPQCDADARPGVDWRQCNKTGVQLLNKDLSRARFNSTNLQGANLFGSTFTHADLSYADLSASNLSFTDFRQARLKGANLSTADLSKANFTAANLSYADLEGAKIADTRFDGANLSQTIWVDGRTCQKGSIGVCRYVR